MAYEFNAIGYPTLEDVGPFDFELSPEDRLAVAEILGGLASSFDEPVPEAVELSASSPRHPSEAPAASPRPLSPPVTAGAGLKRKRASVDDASDDNDVDSEVGAKGSRPRKSARLGPSATAESVDLPQYVCLADLCLRPEPFSAPILSSAPAAIPSSTPTTIPSPDPAPATIPSSSLVPSSVPVPSSSPTPSSVPVPSSSPAPSSYPASFVPPQAVIAQGGDEDPSTAAEPVANEEDGVDVVDAEPVADEGDAVDAVDAEDQENGADEGDSEDVECDPHQTTIWIIPNRENKLKFPARCRIARTDFYYSLPPPGHENDHLQPCDVPGCKSKFMPGSVKGFCYHDGRVHRRLAYVCPNPKCNKVLGRPETLKRHCKGKSACLGPLMQDLRYAFGDEEITNFEAIEPFQHLPMFAIMRPPTGETQRTQEPQRT